MVAGDVRQVRRTGEKNFGAFLDPVRMMGFLRDPL
jgi:hypothetical protein